MAATSTSRGGRLGDVSPAPSQPAEGQLHNRYLRAGVSAVPPADVSGSDAQVTGARTHTSAGVARQQSPAAGRSRAADAGRGPGLLLVTCCIGMVAGILALFASGAVGDGIYLFGLGCVATMGVTMVMTRAWERRR